MQVLFPGLDIPDIYEYAISYQYLEYNRFFCESVMNYPLDGSLIGKVELLSKEDTKLRKIKVDCIIRK